MAGTLASDGLADVSVILNPPVGATADALSVKSFVAPVSTLRVFGLKVSVIWTTALSVSDAYPGALPVTLRVPM